MKRRTSAERAWDIYNEEVEKANKIHQKRLERALNKYCRAK